MSGNPRPNSDHVTVMSAREEFEKFVVPCFVKLVNALRPSLLLDHLRQARLIDGAELQCH